MEQKHKNLFTTDSLIRSKERRAVPHSKTLNITNTEQTECTDKSKTSRNTRKLIRNVFIEKYVKTKQLFQLEHCSKVRRIILTFAMSETQCHSREGGLNSLIDFAAIHFHYSNLYSILTLPFSLIDRAKNYLRFYFAAFTFFVGQFYRE